MLIPPRLNKLLQLLLESTEPLTVNQLAEKLGVSRRTVFRELENTSGLLSPHALQIATKAGEGLRLEGSDEGKSTLLSTLRKEDSAPADKHERIRRLLIELLRNPELQKIYFFAGRFRVSEGTISSDLDSAAKWLEKYHLTLMRKQGLGINVEGDEVDFRRALIHLLEQNEDGATPHGFLGAGLLDEVCAILRGLRDAQFEQMTEDSQSQLAIYLAVVAQRIQAGHTLAQGTQEHVPALAAYLACALEDSFFITLSGAERNYIAVMISGARTNYPNGRVAAEQAMDHDSLQRLACRMIDRFDATIAYELKMDEALVRGLAFHLRSAVVRLQHKIELQNPLLDEVAQSYPDVFQKSRRAAELLRDEYRAVSDSEIGFLSMHFGAAVMRLRERKTHKRTVRVGVLCVNGIGLSYMAASQIKARFQNAVEVEVCVREDMGDPERFDFCVSCIPFEAAGITIIETKPILDESDLDRIRTQISHWACVRGSKPDLPATRDFTERLQRTEWLAHNIQALLAQFHVTSVETDCKFIDLVKLCGYHFGNSPENGKCIFADLMARESISTQVVAEYGFILLHARTLGVTNPIFSLLHPKEQPFTDPYLCGTQTAVVMLAPMDGKPDTGKMMGAISSALVEDEEFLNAVRAGAADRVRSWLESILRIVLTEHTKQLIGSF